MELKKERENLSIDVTALQRLYCDTRGLQGYTLAELDAFNDELKKSGFFFDMEDYYLEGEDKLTVNTKKAIKRF